ncbi:MAG: enoyl-CoA hydratase-related protein, partial [Actinomycetota bacterium]|nr:enoyl-CoA hydratase-related protein [Actinomycetota bacterium]
MTHSPDSVPGLDVSLDDGVLRLTFNRPEVFNALSGEIALALADLLESVPSRDDVRVVVLTG